MFKKILGSAILAILFILTGCGARSQNTNTKQTIHLGWIGPLTGEGANIGNDALQAAKIAIEEINNAGGINGQNLSLIAEDTKCEPKPAVNASTKLINIDRVPVILGGACSGETLAAAPIAENNKTILLSYCASSPKITEAGDYIFRDVPSDNFQGKKAAEYIFQKINKKKTAVVFSRDDWGSGIKEVFVSNYRALGGEIVLEEGFNPTSRDIRTILTKVKNSSAETLYYLAHPEASLAGLKQIRELQINLPIIGADPWDDSNIHKETFAQGITYLVQSKKNITPSWSEKLKEKGANASVCAAPSYDSVMIIKNILEKVGTDPKNIREELYKIQNYSGLSGIISLDNNGDITSAEYEVRIINNNSSTTTDDLTL